MKKPRTLRSLFLTYSSCVRFSRPHPTDENGIKSKGRFVWEIFHKNLGRLGLILALINIGLGLLLAVVPTAVWAVWFALLGVFVIVYLVMEIRLQMTEKRAKSVTLPMKP